MNCTIWNGKFPPNLLSFGMGEEFSICISQTQISFGMDGHYFLSSKSLQTWLIPYWIIFFWNKWILNFFSF
jgi:hypothetical protein